MAFPVKEDEVLTLSEGDTTHVIDLPTGIVVGELIRVFFSCDGAPTITGPGGGWTELANTNNTNVSCATYVRKADGTEGSTVTVTTSGTQTSVSWAARYSGVEDTATQAPEIQVTSVNSSNITPGTLTPAGGAKDYRWELLMCHTQGSMTFTGEDASYTGTIVAASPVADDMTGWRMFFENNAVSENPDTFTFANGARAIAHLINIVPGALPLPGGAPRMLGDANLGKQPLIGTGVLIR